MLTISTLDKTWMSASTFTPSSSSIAIELPADYCVTYNCPICNFKNIIYADKHNNNECCHLVGIVTTFPIKILYFDKKECTVFNFDELQEFITTIQNQKLKNILVKRLNSSKHNECIATEWEVVIMSWLTKFGTCEYEKQNSKGRRPDINWESKDNSIHFTADIKTVFDQFDRDYPAYTFCSQVRDVIEKYIPNTYKIDIRLDNKSVNTPNILDNRIFKYYLAKFETELITKMNKLVLNSTHVFCFEKFEFTVKIVETTSICSIGYASPYYNEVNRNPLYNGLTSKSEQLISDNDEILGIFVCDGDSYLLQNRKKSFKDISNKNIIANFFNENYHIDFIVMFSISNPPISNFQYSFYINACKKVNPNLHELHNIFVNNMYLMSKHCRTPFEVRQDIDIVNNKEKEIKFKNIRKKFE